MAATAATVGGLMAAVRLVALPRRAVTAARRPAEMAASEESAGMAATAAPCWGTPRPAALAARPVIRERAALAATLLTDLAARAVTAATVGRLMAAARLVAMAVRALTAARRPVEMVASEDLRSEEHTSEL